MSKDEQPTRSGFVSVGDLALDLPGVQVPARRERAPQARHHFTQLDQVTQLIGAREANPDLGFMARLLALWQHSPPNSPDSLRTPGASTAAPSSATLRPFG